MIASPLRPSTPNIKICPPCPKCKLVVLSEPADSSLGNFYCSNCGDWYFDQSNKQEKNAIEPRGQNLKESKNILVTKIYTDLGKLWEIANQENNISLKAAILNAQGAIIRSSGPRSISG